MGTNWREEHLGVGLGDQLYSQEILEPGFVKGKTSSLLSVGLWLVISGYLRMRVVCVQTHQQRPRFDGGAMLIRQYTSAVYLKRAVA